MSDHSRITAEMRERLVEMFPDAFAPKGTSKQPLKIGIYHDLRAALPNTAGKTIAAALADYTSGPTYLRNMVTGATRFDLQGKPAGAVGAADAETAKRLMRRFDAQDELRRLRRIEQAVLRFRPEAPDWFVANVAPDEPVRLVTTVDELRQLNAILTTPIGGAASEPRVG